MVRTADVAKVMAVFTGEVMKEREKINWYPIRVTYSREVKFQTMMREEGFETFIPMCVKTNEKNAKKETKIVPAINNLCFVKGCRTRLDDFVGGQGLLSASRYIWNPVTRKPLVVPDKAMDDFIKVSTSMLEDLVYMSQVDSKLRSGQKVKIKNGVFAGVEGVVVRVKRSRRVMVELPGMMAVATGYIPEENLEKI